MALHGEALMSGIRELAASHGLPLRVQGLPMAFHASFGDSGDVRDFRDLQRLDASRYRRFATRLIEEGVWVAGRGIWYVSAAHGEREVEVTLERARAALAGA
jgi:glutamate-1-semialdehyde 2,1-aminomutase